jgi:nucleoside-diphosphate-sugar epimerase
VFEVNVAATYDLVASAARHGCGRFVFGSWHAVYGSHELAAS